MSKLQTGSREELEAIRLQAISHFAPMMLHEALTRLCRVGGAESLERFEKHMVEKIEQAASSEASDFEDMKEFATEQLYANVREVKAAPDLKHSSEDVKNRRTEGRSEQTETLEDQLQAGLEGSFPASDPPAVISTAISGGAKKLSGTDEVLRHRKERHAGAAITVSTSVRPLASS